jgi:uncharacterized protein YceK
MRCRTAWIAGLVAAAALSGCGTFNNLTRSEEGVPLAYGGVRGEWSDLTGMRWDHEYAFVNLIWLPMLAVDLPLTTVGDTITLPYVLARQVYRSIYAPPPSPSPGSGKPDGVPAGKPNGTARADTTR